MCFINVNFMGYELYLNKIVVKNKQERGTFILDSCIL